jgi:hypothetical protein
VFGLDAASGLATCSGACEVRYSITAYPANVVTLGSGTVGAGGTGWASTSDDRPIDFL